jgi:hypothetical protein
MDTMSIDVDKTHHASNSTLPPAKKLKTALLTLQPYPPRTAVAPPCRRSSTMPPRHDASQNANLDVMGLLNKKFSKFYLVYN